MTVRTQIGRQKRKEIINLSDDAIKERIKTLTGKPPMTLARLKKLAIKEERISGLYFLFRRDKLIYVGRTYHMMRRITQHTKTFDKYVAVPMDKKHLAELEALYIYYFNPPLNRTAPRKMEGVTGVTRQTSTKRTKPTNRTARNKKD
jgi:hypothetical protein